MARDVRLDPFLRKRAADPDAAVRSAPAEAVEKVGWTDEARAAAAAARSHGYQTTHTTGKPGDGTQRFHMTHPSGAGTKIDIHSQTGAWTSRGGEGQVARGSGAAKLMGHLNALHGTPVGKQAPPGPRVIEVDGDQDSVARDDELVRPGRVADAPELGKPLVVPDYDPEDYGETPLDPDREEKSAGPRVA